MAIETAAQIRHDMDGQDTPGEAALGAQPVLSPAARSTPQGSVAAKASAAVSICPK
jgi:hypothetical protein